MTLRFRRDECVAASILAELEQLCWKAYERTIGMDLASLCVGECIVKAP